MKDISPKKTYRIANRHMKRWSASLIIRKMQIKTTMRYQLTPTRVAKIKNTRRKCWWGGEEKGTFLYCWCKCKPEQPLWKTVWKFLKKLKIELSYNPVITLLGIYPPNTKTLIQRHTCNPMFTAALFTIAKLWKQPKCPSTDEWIKMM